MGRGGEKATTKLEYSVAATVVGTQVQYYCAIMDIVSQTLASDVYTTNLKMVRIRDP